MNDNTDSLNICFCKLLPFIWNFFSVRNVPNWFRRTCQDNSMIPKLPQYWVSSSTIYDSSPEFLVGNLLKSPDKNSSSFILHQLLPTSSSSSRGMSASKKFVKIFSILSSSSMLLSSLLVWLLLWLIFRSL